MGSIKEEMKPSTKKDIKTVNAADIVGGKPGGLFSRVKERISSKRTEPQSLEQGYADLLEEFDEILKEAMKTFDLKGLVNDTRLLVDRIDIRLQEMIQLKRKSLSGESGREEYNQRSLARLTTMDWHLQTIFQALRGAGDTYAQGATPRTLLENIEFHLDEVASLAIEYGKDK